MTTPEPVPFFALGRVGHDLRAGEEYLAALERETEASLRRDPSPRLRRDEPAGQAAAATPATLAGPAAAARCRDAGARSCQRSSRTASPTFTVALSRKAPAPFNRSQAVKHQLRHHRVGSLGQSPQ
jgi:hypothetical protein